VSNLDLARATETIWSPLIDIMLLFFFFNSVRSRNEDRTDSHIKR